MLGTMGWVCEERQDAVLELEKYVLVESMKALNMMVYQNNQTRWKLK